MVTVVGDKDDTVAADAFAAKAFPCLSFERHDIISEGIFFQFIDCRRNVFLNIPRETFQLLFCFM